MKRAVSLQDAKGPKKFLASRGGGENTASGGQNASWEASLSGSAGAAANGRTSLNPSHLPQSAAQVLFQNNRRGSNGVIPGQQLPNFPVPVSGSLRHGTVGTTADGSISMVRREPSELVSDASMAGDLMHAGLGQHGRISSRQRSRIYDDPAVIAGYNSVPLIDLDRLPRGGISLETQSIGRIQFGIPPETIKDSMQLGFGVPQAYIVPVERFSREMGPALGINLAEFEFPAYFNYFVRQKRCTLVVDSLDAEHNIRRVFGETLLGPAQFRDHAVPKPNEDEDFDPSFPVAARPNFYKEFYHFRTAEKSTNFDELNIDTLLEFCHFKGSQQGRGAATAHEKLGVPPSNAELLQTEESKEEDTSDGTASRRHTFLPHEGDRGESLEDSSRFCSVLDDHHIGGSEDEEEAAAPVPLRRTMSDPDLRKKVTLDDLIRETIIPFSPGVEVEGKTSQDQPTKRMPRRGSMDSTGSFMSRGGRSRDGMSWASGASFMLASDDEDDPSRNSWMYSQAKWLGEVATIYPTGATDEQKRTNKCARVEIFKMTGGTEYIVHDIDVNNIIVGKARFSGTVRVPDEMAVEGFLATKDVDVMTDEEEDESDNASDGRKSADGQSTTIARNVIPPTFHPPSFGVTVLGNSHGFDKNGSTSGYVLWINGRGIMIDPPPYSSATLEREGIRPQMIMAIIITHCHADHDAGTFQKVMTGSRVAIITTPTIYKSFIRKYAALSGLSPTLLRHSHRHRPAIVGQPLKFQGATFHFTYTLHTIPCIAFKVEWRGRSIVFTGDHLNSPPMLESLENLGVLTKARADDLRRLPLQDCDVLLHEAGAPPIHTPLAVLKELPERVKKRLYVVHTSALPADSGLRVAPTGTAGTIRLDQIHSAKGAPSVLNRLTMNGFSTRRLNGAERIVEDQVGENLESILSAEAESCSVPSHIRAEDPLVPGTESDEYVPTAGSASDLWRPSGKKKPRFEPGKLPPLVFLRPTCVSDAWFILNLLSNVPFLSSLSYANTMEVLEIAQVEMFCANEIVISATRRAEVLCVVWEGTCVEREPMADAYGNFSMFPPPGGGERHLSQDVDTNPQDVVYVDSGDGLIRRFSPTVWHAGDWTGPVALQPDTERSADAGLGEGPKDIVALSAEGVKVIMLNMKDLHQILKSGSKLFRKYLALKEKQASEEAAMKAQMLKNEDEVNQFGGHNDMYRIETVAEQMPNHWYAYDSVLEVLKCNSALGKLTALQKRHLESLAEGPRFFECGHYLWQVGEPVDYAFLIVAGTATFAQKPEDEIWRNRRGSTGNMIPTMAAQQPGNRTLPLIEEDKQLYNVPPNSEYARLEIGLQLRVEEMELDVYDQSKDLLPKEERMRNARDRFANKVLARLYSRRAYTGGLVFSRGHLLSDTSRMVSGNLAHIHHTGRTENMGSIGHGLAGDHHCHTSNMIAGPDGSVVMVFPRSSLVQFLDGNPGVLLSLLGTQVVV